MSIVRLSLAVSPVLFVAATRSALEATMQRHMVVQLPVLFAAGLLLGQAFAGHVRRGSLERHLRDWNAQGVAGLLLASGVIMTWMVPRALDAAVESVVVDGLKMLSLVASGAITWQSWRAASVMVRTFFVGNIGWMMTTVGMLLLDTPVRLCANYGSSDQRVTGISMVILTVAAVAGTAVRTLFFPMGSSAPSHHR